MKTRNYFLLILGIFILAYLGYNIFLDINYYVVSTSLEADKISSISIEKNDIHLCNKLRTPPFPLFISGVDVTEEDLIRGCYIGAIQIGVFDETQCNSLGFTNEEGLRDYCIRYLAQRMKDVSLCDKIKDQIEKNSCYSILVEEGLDISICDKINSWNTLEKDACYIGSAIYSGDITICKDKIKSQEEKNVCYFNIASKNKDSSLCKNIVEEDKVKEDDYIKNCLENAQNS